MFAISLCERLAVGEEAIAVVGLGYVGLPIAVAFSKTAKVIGFDINAQKVEQYRRGLDPTKEVGEEAVAECTVEFTSDERRLREASFIIVAVPTPVDEEHAPDLSLLKHASRIVGRQLSEGTIVVYESTVYPGVTEDICRPILEEESGLRCGVDFKLGYSPERINPGDKAHRLETIVKVVSAIDEETLCDVAEVYGLVVKAGIHRAPSIRVAEAAKVIENSQRDINIAFMNELAMIFHEMDLDTKAVLEAAATKWNFLNFCPGLVGGHCVGVDPYYLTYKAAELGFESRIIAAGRQINDEMGHYVVRQVIRRLTEAKIPLSDATVAIVGLTFKENCPDTRNSRAVDMYNLFREYGVTPLAADPLADPEETKREHGIVLTPLEAVRQVDVLIVAVAHDVLKAWSAEELDRMFKADSEKFLFDIKGLWDREALERAGYQYWRL